MIKETSNSIIPLFIKITFISEYVTVYCFSLSVSCSSLFFKHQFWQLLKFQALTHKTEYQCVISASLGSITSYSFSCCLRPPYFSESHISSTSPGDCFLVLFQCSYYVFLSSQAVNQSRSRCAKWNRFYRYPKLFSSGFVLSQMKMNG